MKSFIFLNIFVRIFVKVEDRQRRLVVTSGQHCSDGRGQQDGGGGDEQRVAWRTGRPGECFGGRLHASVKHTVVELGNGTVLRPPALQTAVFRLVLPHRVGFYVSVTEKKYE